jgi:hypothetical protein
MRAKRKHSHIDTYFIKFCSIFIGIPEYSSNIKARIRTRNRIRNDSIATSVARCTNALQIATNSTAMLVFYSYFANIYIVNTFLQKRVVTVAALAILIVMTGSMSFAQSAPKSQEVSEADGQPVILKHLPDYTTVQSSAVFVVDKAGLKSAAGNEPVLDGLEFGGGTEAVIAVYPQGRLVIIEYTNPQSSVEADAKVQQFIGSTQPNFVYRRIGNYNAFVFGTTDTVAAGELLDQIKYQKTVQWLGEDPYILKKLERYMVTTSKDIMISTVLVIVFGLGVSVLAGIAAGFIFFRFRDQKRAGRAAFSDAGGLTRLNLDGLSE